MFIDTLMYIEMFAMFLFYKRVSTVRTYEGYGRKITFLFKSATTISNGGLILAPPGLAPGSA